MARLKDTSDNDEEFPDLSTLLHSISRSPISVKEQHESESQEDIDDHRGEKTIAEKNPAHHRRASSKPLTLNSPNAPFMTALSDTRPVRKQRPLSTLQSRYVSLSTLPPPRRKDAVRTDYDRDRENPNFAPDDEEEARKFTPRGRRRRRGPTSKQTANRTITSVLNHANELSLISENDDLSNFIVDDSDMEHNLPVRSPRKLLQRRTPRSTGTGLKLLPSEDNCACPKIINPSATVIDLTSPEEEEKEERRPTVLSIAASAGSSPYSNNVVDDSTPKLGAFETPSDDDDNSLMIYKKNNFTPITRSPRKYKGESCIIAAATTTTTPPPQPPSPSKIKLLKSPSKKRPPPKSPPHRPSLAAFWSQELVNDWNDQHYYSPSKTPKYKSLVVPVLKETDEFETSQPPPPAITTPVSSRKSPIKKSPVKKDKEEIQRRKMFNDKKMTVATSFLEDLDKKITNEQVAALAASTGGIKIIWSKKLTSTAGRAHWRRENLRVSNVQEGPDETILPTTTTATTSFRHHASIELAEKIIDDEDRLFNVIAHEYCHLANFMISGVKDKPHGKEFKEWARKVTVAFSHLSVNVTTLHSYTIAYKYVWVCTRPSCGLEYKRHSRSIDPTSHQCGKCSGRLAQVKPVPRVGNGSRTSGEEGMEKMLAGDEVRKAGSSRGKYQEYVKMHFARVRSENPELGMAGWMVELGRKFREEKVRETSKEGVDSVQHVTAVVNIEEEGAEQALVSAEGGIESVTRKLNFISLVE